MPGQDQDHGPELDPLGPAGHVGQQLGGVAGHSVGAEVMLDRPERIESERLDQIGQIELALQLLGVGDGVRLVEGTGLDSRRPLRDVAESRRHAYFHGMLPC